MAIIGNNVMVDSNNRYGDRGDDIEAYMEYIQECNFYRTIEQQTRDMHLNTESTADIVRTRAKVIRKENKNVVTCAIRTHAGKAQPLTAMK